MSDAGITGVLEKVLNTTPNQGVMIALLPISGEWSKLEVPHLTLVYAGEKNTLSELDFVELAKDAAMLAMMNRVTQLRVMGRDQFGGDGEDKVDVLRLQPSPELWSMRRAVERWNASQHPFSPHCTIGPAGTFIEMTPSYIAFDKICVGWGDEYLSFNMKR
jgi:2'-5' RNA ligase